MEKRIGVIAIIVRKKESIPRVNGILSEFNNVIVGRMGVPYSKRGLSVIALIVDGTTDEIGAITGKLGSLRGIEVKSALGKPLEDSAQI